MEEFCNTVKDFHKFCVYVFFFFKEWKQSVTFVPFNEVNIRHSCFSVSFVVLRIRTLTLDIKIKVMAYKEAEL